MSHENRPSPAAPQPPSCPQVVVSLAAARRQLTASLHEALLTQRSILRLVNALRVPFAADQSEWSDAFAAASQIETHAEEGMDALHALVEKHGGRMPAVAVRNDEQWMRAREQDIQRVRDEIIRERAKQFIDFEEAAALEMLEEGETLGVHYHEKFVLAVEAEKARRRTPQHSS